MSFAFPMGVREGVSYEILLPFTQHIFVFDCGTGHIKDRGVNPIQFAIRFAHQSKQQDTYYYKRAHPK